MSGELATGPNPSHGGNPWPRLIMSIAQRRALMTDDSVKASTTPRSSTRFNPANRQGFIGGSDARIIMGADEKALLRLWREKRGEVEPEDLSGNLIVQLGNVTEQLNRHWYERNTGQVVTDVQRRVQHPVVR